MYMHDAGYTRSRFVSWIHMYNGDEQEVRRGERIEVQKRRPHSASKSESRVTQTQNTPTKCTYHINHSHGRRIASRKNA